MVNKNTFHGADQGNIPNACTVIYELQPLDGRDVANDQNENPSSNFIQVPNDARRSKRCRHRLISMLVTLGLILIIQSIRNGKYQEDTKNWNSNRNSYPYQPPPSPRPSPPRKICHSGECIRAAERISALHNGSINPCQDFYGYSCGKIQQNQNGFNSSKAPLSTLKEVGESIPQLVRELLEEEPNEDVKEPEAVKKARYLYSNCTNNQSQPSQWPSFLENPLNVTDALESLLAQLLAHGVSNFFTLQVIRDRNDTSKYVLMFNKENPLRDRLDISAANKYIKDNLRMFGRLKDPEDSSDSAESSEEQEESSGLSEEDIINITNFERDYLRLVDTKCGAKDNLKLPEKITLHRMEEQFPGIKWTSLVQQLFTILKLPHTISSKTAVYLGCPDYFRALLNLVHSTRTRTVINYLTLRFIINFEHLNKELDNPAAFENYFPQILPEESTEDMPKEFERWELCARIVNDGLGLAVAHLYGKKQPKEVDEGFVLEMFRYLKMAFREVIITQVWIEVLKEGWNPRVMNDFQLQLISKLDYMKIKIGYPDYIMNGSALDEDYSGLNLNQSSFLLNVLEVMKFQTAKTFMKIYRKVDNDKEWYSPPLTANAFYAPSANEIVLPAGILRFPMLDGKNPTYLNFAKLGSILAHEMVHGFDLTGIQYDKYGNFTSWWPERSKDAFLDKAVCFVIQYEKFMMPFIHKNVDGILTLSENICDNAALHLAMRAYDLWERDGKRNEPVLPGLNLTLRQIFLVSFGQIWCENLKKEDYEKYSSNEHSPGQFRVLGVAQNSRDFADEFSCPYGSPMNPREKCSLWACNSISKILDLC